MSHFMVSNHNMISIRCMCNLTVQNVCTDFDEVLKKKIRGVLLCEKRGLNSKIVSVGQSECMGSLQEDNVLQNKQGQIFSHQIYKLLLRSGSE